MFTGLVEAIGRVAGITRRGAVVRLSIEAPFAGELKNGQSVCVSGACLTVVGSEGGKFSVEMMNETVERTKFSSLNVGAFVNLERALRAGDRLDGHFVLGHVDGVGRIKNISAGAGHVVQIAAPDEIMAEIVPKGSVALDGVSLTVIDAEAGFFSVGLIPMTLEDCTMGSVKVGDVINIETDIIGKYILSAAVRHSVPGTRSITMNRLLEMGYV